MCRCPAHDDRSPSLSVRAGRSALLFKCFAGCTIVEIFAALRHHGIEIRSSREGVAHRPVEPRRTNSAARRLWDEAAPLTGTPGERYLTRRNISLPSTALRYHPATPLGAGKDVRFLPAMLAAVSEGREFVAIQRIFLQPNGRPAPMTKHKRTLGPPGRGAVRLSPVGTVLGLAEGVENALSAAILFNMPVWATLGAERFDRILVPDRVVRLVLFADNDQAGLRATQRAEAAYSLPGRQVETMWPEAPFNDWNDRLRAGGEDVVEGGG